MKTQIEIINLLNSLLRDEFGAIQTYIFCAEINKNYGYEKLYKFFKEKIKDEKSHSKKLIRQILYLEGIPAVNEIGEIKMPLDIVAQLSDNLILEMTAIQKYNDAIHILTCDIIDNTTRHILNNILDDENEHYQELEGLMYQVKQLGIENFLTEQL
jgi:bacterioferritin